MFRIPLTTIAIVAALGSPAVAWTARNGLDVEAGSRPGEVIVEYDAMLDATDFWCAAGDYVTRALGMPASTRLYRSASPRRPGGPYAFTTNKEDGTPKSGISTFGRDRDDTSISAGHAAAAFYRPLRFDLF